MSCMQPDAGIQNTSIKQTEAALIVTYVLM